jgi:hypothetical protein
MFAQASQAVQSVAMPAIEAGKSGISIFFDAGVIGLIVTNSAFLIKAFIDRKAVKREKDSEEERPCSAHAERLVRLESFIVPDKERRLATLEANYISTNKILDAMRQENREDHQQIFAAIEQLKK